MNQQNKPKNKKDFQEVALLPSQKESDESRSPSSKFSNKHFQQLESNLPFDNRPPISPANRPTNSSNVGDGLSEAAKIKLQKQLEYAKELEYQTALKVEAEKQRKRNEEELDRKLEEANRIHAENERKQVEKERREK